MELALQVTFRNSVMKPFPALTENNQISTKRSLAPTFTPPPLPSFFVSARARDLGTINYEVATSLAARLPRVYVDDFQP
jgi:hypothetical protein